MFVQTAAWKHTWASRLVRSDSPWEVASSTA